MYFTFNRKDDYEDHIRIEQERKGDSQKDMRFRRKTMQKRFYKEDTNFKYLI